MSARASTIFTVATVTLLGGLVAYAVYFDYRRRNDVDFRKKLRKEKKRAGKNATQAESASSASLEVSQADLRAAMGKLKDEPLPQTPEEKEHYFMSQVNLGEQLCAQGPSFHLAAALSFYRALRVYPSPVELIVIYQKTVPEPVFKLVMELTNMDVIDRIEGYYNFFPPKSMNVAVQPVPDDKQGKKRLVVTKDFKEGEEIYIEEPIVVALDADLQGKGTHCTYCLRSIEKDAAVTPKEDRIKSVYCSEDCQTKSKIQSDNLLFGLEPVLPVELDAGLGGLTQGERDKAQSKFVTYLESQGKSAPLMVARFVARQVAIETGKMNPHRTSPSPVDLPKLVDDDEDYGLYDHMERLRFIDATVTDDETKLLCDVLAAALPGLDKTLNEERHTTYMGKMAYNAFGVCFDAGRDDKPEPTARPEDQERTRTPYGTSRQIGSGFYAVSSYIVHSCAPSARPSFSSGTSKLHLVATRDLKEGDEITVSYVDSTVHDGETIEEAARRRRQELARGWKFKCECSRCLIEVASNQEKEVDLGVENDESKLEKTVERLERPDLTEGSWIPVAPDVE